MQVFKELTKKGPFYKWKHPTSLHLRRWPEAPKLSIISPPGLSKNEIAQRLAIDLAIPVVSINDIFSQVIQNDDGEFAHPFYNRARALLLENNYKELIDQRIPLKLLLLHPYTQQGFILTDFPNNTVEAELLEEMHGGMNGLIHCWLEKEWLAKRYMSRYIDPRTSEEFFMESVVEAEDDPEMPQREDEYVRLDKKLPVDEVTAQKLKRANNELEFERKYENYLLRLSKIEPFYKKYGLLTNCRMAQGLGDFKNMKRRLQNNIKH